MHLNIYFSHHCLLLPSSAQPNLEVGCVDNIFPLFNHLAGQPYIQSCHIGNVSKTSQSTLYIIFSCPILFFSFSHCHLKVENFGQSYQHENLSKLRTSVPKLQEFQVNSQPIFSCGSNSIYSPCQLGCPKFFYDLISGYELTMANQNKRKKK